MWREYQEKEVECDRLQRIHTLRNLAWLVEEGRTGGVHSLQDDSLRERVSEGEGERLRERGEGGGERGREGGRGGGRGGEGEGVGGGGSGSGREWEWEGVGGEG